MLGRLLAFAALAASFIPASFAQQGQAVGQGKVVGSGQIFVGPPTPPATVSIAPASQVLAVSTTQNFTATVTNDSFNQGVTWTLTGPNCSGATCGTISATTSKSGVPITYTAPASAPSPNNAVVLTATSNLNPAGLAHANITITNPPPPVVVGNICGTLQFQTPAATNTFTCPPSNSSFIAFTIAVSTTDTPTGVQACLPLPAGSPGACFNLIQACTPTNVCQGITTPGGISQIWYAIGLPVGITTLIVTNSPAAGGVIDVSAIDAQNIVAFGGAAASSANTTATTNPVGPAITVVPNSLTISAVSTTGTVTAVAAPFTFVGLSGGDGVAYQLNSTAGITTPNWTSTSGTWSGFTATFLGGTTKPVISVAMNPTTASVKVNTTLAVTPTVTNDTAGVNLALTGANCSGATCGTLSSSTTASGVSVTYTAPAAVPSPSAVVTLTASSITDPTKTATTTITVTSTPIVVSVSPGSATVQTSANQTFSCTVTNDAATAGCDWTLTGAGCSGATCGGLSVSHTASGVTLTYTGPASVPSPATVSLTATSTTDNTKSAVATITVVAAPAIVVSVSPGSASVQTSLTHTFACTVTNDPAAAGCDWALTGGGCSGATCGTLSTTHTASGVTLTYTAPASAPSPATVTLTATSTTDATKSAAATITVVAAPVLTVVVAPGSASVQTGLTQSFTPTVTNDGGSAGVDWTLTGAGCSGATCGTISLTHTASGTPTVYTAPATVPSPATVTIKATSTTDNTKSASSTITVFALPIVVSVAPGTATVPVNGTQAFTPTVTNDGANAGVDWTLGSCTTFTESFNEGTLPAIWNPTTATGVEGGGSFSPSHISLSQGVLQMSVTQDGTTAGSVGAEIELNREFGYGTYSWSMQAAGTSATAGASGSAVSGQISSTFQYASGTNPVTTEIDAPEIEGQFPTQIEYTTYLNGVKSDYHQTTLANPQNTYHVYKYIWAPGSINFYLDGSLVATTTTNVPTQPAYPITNLWGTNSTNFGGLATAGVTRYMYINNFTYSNCGTLSATHTASGTPVTYTAPPNVPSPATVTITATSTTDPTKSATSTITIGTAPNITIAVVPTTASVTTNGTQAFTATLTNDTSNQGATWALTGSGCSGATCGSLSKSGSASGVPITYTAPASVPSPATVTLTATSVTDPTKTATATITVTSAVVTVTVSPSSATFQAGSGSQLFTASVANSAATPAWTLSCSVSNCGSITPASGFTTTYTPPASVVATITVTLTATVTGPVSGTATITVNPTTGPFSCVGKPCPAFAGTLGTAQGSAAGTPNGRGGVVYNITSLADTTNAGCVPFNADNVTCTLRDCAQASGARNCIFRVAGLIAPLSRLTVGNPNIYIAGQSAPGGGITLGGPTANGDCMFLSSHDILVRFLSYTGDNPNVNTGPEGGTGCFEVASGATTNIFLDHLSARWYGNKAFALNNNGVATSTLTNITYSYIMAYEPICGPGTPTSYPLFGGTYTINCHPVGSLGTDATTGSALGTTNIDFHHNMIYGADHRLPFVQSANAVRWVNNIQACWNQYAALSYGGMVIDWIGDKWVDCDLSTTFQGVINGDQVYTLLANVGNDPQDPSDNCLYGPCDNPGSLAGPPTWYLLNNTGRVGIVPVNHGGTQLTPTNVVNDAGEKSMTQRGWEGGYTGDPNSTGPLPAAWFRGTPLPTEAFPIVPDPVTNVDNTVTATVGAYARLDCLGNVVNIRNSQDARVISQYLAGTGATLFNFQIADPAILPGTACVESLHDGIPDQWKSNYGLNTANTSLYKTPDPVTGLTYLEDYLDGLVPGGGSTGSTFTAASCSQANVNAVLNGPTHTAVDGDTIVIPAGSCTWTTGVTIPSGIGITITGAGTPNSTPATKVAASPSTILTDSITGGGNMFTTTPTYGNSLTRISMMKIIATNPSTGYGQPIYMIATCTSKGCPNVRIDNLTIPNSAGSCSISDGTFAVVDNMFGVADHNSVGDATDPGCFAWDFINVGHGNWLGVGHWGDNSWANADTLGTSQALYLENNTFNYSFGTDSDFYEGNGNFGGGRFVCRFNVFVNLQGNTACTNHGTDTGGRLRGGRQLEFYDNAVSSCAGGTCNAVEGWRSGTARLFGNTLTGTSNTFVSFDTDRRWRVDSPWIYCDGNSPWDTDDGTTYVTGLTISSSTVINGDQYVITSSGSPGWTTNQWASSSGHPYSFVDTTRQFSFEILSNTSNTITAFISCPGNGCSEGPTNGDSYKILRATVCLDQSGRGAGLLVEGGDGTISTDGHLNPILVSTGNPGAVTEALDPFYEANDGGGTVTGVQIESNDSQGNIANRDWYGESVGQTAQASTTSPFNGTSGMGHGSLANRPTTCSPSVGYLATDQGSWNASGSGGQGQFYTCTATNTWTLSYTPYTYPHPLVQ